MGKRILEEMGRRILRDGEEDREVERKWGDGEEEREIERRRGKKLWEEELRTLI